VGEVPNLFNTLAQHISNNSMQVQAGLHI